MIKDSGTCGGWRNTHRFLMAKPEGQKSLYDLRVNGSITLKWILKKWDNVAWAGLIWLGIWTTGRLL
jgi:hypothetical protein